MAKVQQGEPLDMAQLSAVEINSLRAQRDQLMQEIEWERFHRSVLEDGLIALSKHIRIISDAAAEMEMADNQCDFNRCAGKLISLTEDAPSASTPQEKNHIALLSDALRNCLRSMETGLVDYNPFDEFAMKSARAALKATEEG